MIGFADRVAAVVGSAIAEAVGLTPDGSTSGITSVLVFGAGTNYALLLISRYREELGRNENHRDALRVAVRQAGPAILASNATVVLALLTLLLASSPSTRSLGVQAAAGLVVAAVFVLLVLPPLLALFGRRLFWPFIPAGRSETPYRQRCLAPHRRCGGTQTGPRRAVAIAGLALLCTRTAEHTDRPVADRAVPGAGRVGQRLRDARGPLSQRPDRPHPRHRRDRQGSRGRTGDHVHARRGLGESGRRIARRTQPVVGGAARRACIRRGVQNH